MKNIEVISATELRFLGKSYKCAIGENGFTSTPKEGAKQTPIGNFPLRECWYREDRLSAPVTKLPLKIIKPDDGWCDAPEDKNYNRRVTLPFSASHEELWRKDNTYDIMVPMGFNDVNIVPGKGSAIFFHLAKPSYTPTLGCVAVSLDDMLAILANIEKESLIIINPVK